MAFLPVISAMAATRALRVVPFRFILVFMVCTSEKCVFPAWGTVLITLRRQDSNIILHVFCTMFEAGICTHYKAATRVMSRAAARKVSLDGRFLHFFVIEPEFASKKARTGVEKDCGSRITRGKWRESRRGTDLRICTYKHVPT